MLHSTLQTNATQMAPAQRGTAVSLFASCLFIGQSGGVALAGWTADRIGTPAILLIGGTCVFALGLAFRRALIAHGKAARAA
jgi:predicted MFS family arabinose efflux permease